MSELRKAVFFDRDGVINRRIKGGYVRHWGEFELDPVLPQVLAEIQRRGYLAIIITNQRGVGKGLMTQQALDSIHDSLQELLANETQTRFDDIYFCTDIDDSPGRRKPSPAMLLEAAAKWNIDLGSSWMIGDTQSDIAAGLAAGTRTLFLITEHTEEIPPATHVIRSLEEVLRYVG